LQGLEPDGCEFIICFDRHLVWINVTANPTAEWIARQITEASPGISHLDTSSGTETPRTAMP
jgi:hypothetical protein